MRDRQARCLLLEKSRYWQKCLKKGERSASLRLVMAWPIGPTRCGKLGEQNPDTTVTTGSRLMAGRDAGRVLPLIAPISLTAGRAAPLPTPRTSHAGVVPGNWERVPAALAILSVIGSEDEYVLPSAKWGAPLLLSGVGGVLGAVIDHAVTTKHFCTKQGLVDWRAELSEKIPVIRVPSNPRKIRDNPRPVQPEKDPR